MKKIDILIKSLEKNKYAVSYFETKEDAIEYLSSNLQNTIIGFGDSKTISEMNLNKILSVNNIVIDPNKSIDNDDFLKIAKKCLTTEIYITSANSITEEGTIINLDGTGNRIASSLFGHKKVYYIIGKNKITQNIDTAIFRVRNIAAPKNAKRLKLKTPCAINGDKCYDCSSPERICNGLLVQLRKMNDMETEIVIINENLGF